MDLKLILAAILQTLDEAERSEPVLNSHTFLLFDFSSQKRKMLLEKQLYSSYLKDQVHEAER